jgi:ribonucleoside-diphosphate reductase alpha chain
MNEDVFGEFIFKRTYARWIEEEQRRENWDETVARYRNYFLERFDLPQEMEDNFNHACDMIQNKEIVPSMRCLWTAGAALDEDNIAGFNCTFLLIDSVKSFADQLYLLMNGCGTGYSVERQVINKLPIVPDTLTDVDDVVVFADSKLGWAEGLLEYMTKIYDGKIPKYDLSLIRPKGARLKTFGGKAGGSDDLRLLLDYLKVVFQKAHGRRLVSLECHDICCFIANVVVSAGIRRSACISLSNLSDPRMRDCKIGEFWLNNPQRSMANNSAAYTEKPDMHIWMLEWMSLMNSGSGERGIFNRESSKKQFEKLGRSTVDSDGNEYLIGTNPCGEILLRPNEACNLSEVIVRPDDTLETLIDKVESATVIGCVQSCLTTTKFLDPIWKINMEDERLLGVSLTGVRDHHVLNNVSQLSSMWLTTLRNAAHDMAVDCAITLEMNVPAAITCNKPSGTVSALLNTASGVHTRFSPYYIRRVRVSTTDVLCKFLMSVGVPNHPEIGQDNETANTRVFDFPIKAPDGAIFDTPALEQLDYWRMFKKCWCHHNPSVTIMVEEHEWLEVGSWVYKNWDIVGGLSFLPKSDNVYQLAPFQEISKEEYDQRVSEMPEINFDDLTKFEREDETVGAQILACTGNNCEVY